MAIWSTACTGASLTATLEAWIHGAFLILKRYHQKIKTCLDCPLSLRICVKNHIDTNAIMTRMGGNNACIQPAHVKQSHLIHTRMQSTYTLHTDMDADKHIHIIHTCAKTYMSIIQTYLYIVYTHTHTHIYIHPTNQPDIHNKIQKYKSIHSYTHPRDYLRSDMSSGMHSVIAFSTVI